MNINELLQLRGLDLSKKIKILRHKDSRDHGGQKLDCHRLHRDGWLLTYESFQSTDLLNCDYTVAMLGLERNRAVFVGVRKVIEKGRRAQKTDLPDGCPLQEIWTEPETFKNAFFYELEPVPGFEDLEDRVVVDWDSPGNAWHQYLNTNPKRVVEIWPEGYVREFPGFLNILLEFHELKRIVENPDANSIWHTMLKSMSGVYMILDRTSGKQYVGSAYGKTGLLGRWKTYVNDGHGGNKQLMKLLEECPGYQKNFLFSVLHILPNSVPKNEVIGWEEAFKSKLGSRAFGLN